MSRSDIPASEPSYELRTLFGEFESVTTAGEVIEAITGPFEAWQRSPVEDASLWWDTDDASFILIFQRPEEAHWVVQLTNQRNGWLSYCRGSPHKTGRLDLWNQGSCFSIARTYLCHEDLVERIIREAVEEGRPRSGIWDTEVDMVHIDYPERPDRPPAKR